MVTADSHHPIRVAIDPKSREPRPYVTVRPGLEARICRAVFYELVALAQPEQVDGPRRPSASGPKASSSHPTTPRTS
jgi:hypothetical protein